MMDAEEIAHFRRLRDQYERNVRRLKEQAAEHGLDVPLSITNGIEEFEAKIAEIDRELASTEALAAPAAMSMASVSGNVDTESGVAIQPAATAQPAAIATIPATSAPTPQIAGFPTTPQFLVLYGGATLFLIAVLLTPFAGDENSPMGQFTALLGGFGLIIGGVVGALIAIDYVIKRVKQ